MKVPKNSRRLEVFDFIRSRLDTIGVQPTNREVGEAIGMSAPGVWKHVQALIGGGQLIDLGKGRIDLPGRTELVVVPTDQLRGELARRGVTLDALERPKVLMDKGRACAANHCLERVGRGMLMCRRHWFRLPPNYRSSIMSAWSARQSGPYGEAVEAARNFLGGYSRVSERVQ